MWWTIAALAAPELCNGLDDDGDMLVDEGPNAWGLDADGDGHGSGLAAMLTPTCAGTPGFVPSIDDPDDLDPSSFPGAPEVCDGRDQNGDGAIDENACKCDVTVDATSVWHRCEEVADWPTADAECAVLGGHLASLQDQLHQDAAWSAIAAYPEDHWLGGTDASLAGAWAWADATPFTYTFWRMGQPDNGGNDYESEDCLEITSTGEWNDRDCTIALPYLCERDCTEVRYEDDDGDGFGDPTRQKIACAIDDGLTTNVFDCNDFDPNEPALVYLDSDGDGYPGSPWIGCGVEGAAEPTDCDDTDATVSPGAAEAPRDGVDSDCDGFDGLEDTTAHTEPTDTGTPPDPTDTDDEPPDTDDAPGPPIDADGDGAADVSEPGSADDAGGAWAEPPAPPRSGCGSTPATAPATAAAALVAAVGGAARSRRRRGR
ncbi:MAG: lectin-like protein [Myxococcota bacterium]